MIALTQILIAWAKAFDANPTADSAHRAMLCFRRLGNDPRRAVKYGEEAVKLEPKKATYRMALALAYADAGLGVRANGEIGRALALEPQNPKIKKGGGKDTEHVGAHGRGGEPLSTPTRTVAEAGPREVPKSPASDRKHTKPGPEPQSVELRTFNRNRPASLKIPRENRAQQRPPSPPSPRVGAHQGHTRQSRTGRTTPSELARNGGTFTRIATSRALWMAGQSLTTVADGGARHRLSGGSLGRPSRGSDSGTRKRMD